MKARSIQCCLWFAARLATICSRLLAGGLMPVMARELGYGVRDQGHLLSAWSLGCVLTQVLGGVVSDRLGGKRVMTVAIVLLGLGSLALGSFSSLPGMWCTMLLMGTAEGTSLPTTSVLIVKWSPLALRTSATAISEAGGPTGALVALFAMPQVASLYGWRFAFRLWGWSMLLFAVLWEALAASAPETCSYIRGVELEDLRSQGVVADDTNAKVKPQSRASPCSTTWRVLRLPSVWAAYLTHIFFGYNRYLLYGWVLTYLVDGLGLEPARAGRVMFWPSATDAVLSIAVGGLADRVLRSGRLSTTGVRRLFSTLGFLGTGFGALALDWARGHGSIAVLVTLTCATQAFHCAGYKVYYGDLSQRHTGLVNGIGATLAVWSTYAAPLAAATLLSRGGGAASLDAWQSVFHSMFLASALGASIFLLLAESRPIDDRIEAPSIRDFELGQELAKVQLGDMSPYKDSEASTEA